MSSTKGLVLVTGANGYIAARTVEAFLKAGYSVRGTVRRRASADELVAALSDYADHLEIVEVPDITISGAFDEAVKGVDAIAHLASPVSINFTDPEPVMKAAVQGTLRILESAYHQPTPNPLKSFVLMSSIAAILPEKEGPYTFTEADWNDQALTALATLGKNAPGGLIYRASKTAAEKTLWEFRDKAAAGGKPLGFTTTAINPSFVAGPPLVVPATRDGISNTTRIITNVYAGDVPLDKIGYGPTVTPGYVDIRDVARMVVFAVAHPEKSDGERFMTVSTYGTPQGVADILREKYPDRKGVILEGTPGKGYTPGHGFPGAGEVVYDGSKVVRVSGQGYVPWEQTVVDTVEMLKGIL